jgi:hypothetical protein
MCQPSASNLVWKWKIVPFIVVFIIFIGIPLEMGFVVAMLHLECDMV